MSRVFEDFTDFGIGNRLTSNSPVLGDHTYTPSMTQHFWYAPQSFTPVHDADGNLTDDGRWTYLWDAENRLIQMESTTQATAAGHPYTKLQFVYDWQGRRIARHVWQGGTQASPTFKSSRRWLYDGWNVITEFSAPSATSTTLTRLNTFTWGLDLGDHDGIPRQRAGGVGGLISLTQITYNPITYNYYAPSYDGNGNIVAWTKSNASAPTSRREYDAFGNTLVSEGVSPSTFGFSTKMQDVETGLYYYGYRFYDPVAGRWPSRDPIEEQGGENLYGFVLNGVVNGLDLLGLKLIRYEEDTDGLPVSYSSRNDPNHSGHNETKFPEEVAYVRQRRFGKYKQNVKLHGELTIKLYYHESSTDIDATKKHERHHAKIYKDWWNMVVDEISWIETDWCVPCGQLAAAYGNATAKARRSQAIVENWEFDRDDQIARFGRVLPETQASLDAESKRMKDAKKAYDKAKKAFYKKCLRNSSNKE